jgi:hypothetical protein
MWLWWLMACGTPTPEVEPAAPVVATAPAPAAKEPESPAVLAAKALGKRLKERLTGVMQAEGPVAAARVCADEAQVLTAAANSGGVKVGRSSMKLRNPGNAPPAWVATWLAAGSATPWTSSEGGVSRAILPIVIEPACLTCHGDKSGIPPEVASLLAERYPNDAATGYAVGDLRGALWAEVQKGAP